MRLVMTILALVCAAAAVAQEPATRAPFEPSVRLMYEGDTRAYYRPCG